MPNEDLVNLPNWLILKPRPEGEEAIRLADAELLSYRHHRGHHARRRRHRRRAAGHAEGIGAGERSTGWAATARATFTGVSAATTAAMLARGAMEGVALGFARIAGQLASATEPARQILASGRITQQVPDLPQLLADVLGVPVTPVTSKRTTLRGTAIMALDVLAPGTPRAQPATGPARRPVTAHHAHYAQRVRAYQALHDAVIASVTG